MALLLLDRSNLEIKTEGETLAIYENGQRRGTVPVQLIDRCIIHGAQTRLDTGVLMKLAEAGVTTVIFSPRQQRRVAIVLGPQHNDAAVRLAQSARVLDDNFCRQWALDVVRAKLARQRRTLLHLKTQRPDARKPLFDALQTLNAITNFLSQAGKNGAAQPNLESLRGHEGAAARAYFSGLAGVMPPALQWPQPAPAARPRQRLPVTGLHLAACPGGTGLHHRRARSAAGFLPPPRFWPGVAGQRPDRTLAPGPGFVGVGTAAQPHPARRAFQPRQGRLPFRQNGTPDVLC